MIVYKRSSFFCGNTSVVRTSSFTCTVSTKREGLFGPLSTLIFRGDGSVIVDEAKLCGKITYSPDLAKSDIMKLHPIIVQELDREGEKGFHLGASLQYVIDYLKEEGIASEAINAAHWDGI